MYSPSDQNKAKVCGLATPRQHHAQVLAGPIRQGKEANGTDQRVKDKIASICIQLTYKKTPRTNKFSKVL